MTTTTNLTFNDLPKVVATLVGEISTLKNLINEIRDEKQAPKVDELMTIEQASEFMHLTIPTMYNKVSKNEIPFMKRGKRLYFSKMDLMDYLKSGRNKLDAEIEQEVNEYLSRKRK